MPVGAVTLAIADPQLRGDLQRLVAVAGAVSRPVDLAAVRLCWPSGGAIVVDDTAAHRCVQAGLPRRAGVIVVASGDVCPDLWPVAVALGAEQVFAVPAQEQRVVDWLAALDEPIARARLIAVLPVRGGVGASVLSAVVALAAARDRSVCLLDGDPWGGGLDLVLGAEEVAGARWPDLAEASGVLAAAAFSAALPQVGGVRLLSADARRAQALPPEAVASVLRAARRACDVVVVDATSGRDGLMATVTAAAELTVVVTPADVRAAAVAAPLVAELADRQLDARLVVRHPGPGDLRPADVAAATGAPVLATWSWERRLGALVDNGELARGWRRTAAATVAGRVLGALTERAS